MIGSAPLSSEGGIDIGVDNVLVVRRVEAEGLSLAPANREQWPSFRIDRGDLGASTVDPPAPHMISIG